MPGRIPENILDDILARVDIVEIISGFLPLKKAGRNFKACCPFHHEKTASFMVSPDRQIYHCFGCGESGNAFKFLMRYERLDFPEAVEVLARKVGVVLPRDETPGPKSSGISTQMYRINELAANFYSANLNLPAGLKAKEYLLKRGVRPEIISALKLGFAPDNWDGLLNYLRSKGVSLGFLEKAGLAIAKDSGGFYDRFRNRIIFPIFDIKGRVLGFGARVLDNSLPKYVNSPETAVYTKRKNLYGFNLAKDGIRENDFVVIVEGYLDFILPFQEGLKNITASLGTALTIEQARFLKRYTHNVVMVYDADTAGELATLRSLDIFIEEEMSVRVVSLPKGLDPDSFVRQEGIGAFKEKIACAESLFDYKLKILKSRYNPKEIEGRAKLSGLMLETIARFKNAILKSEYLKKLAQELNLKEEALLEEIKKVKTEKMHAEPQGLPVRKTHNTNPTEKLLMSLMLEESDLINRIRETLSPRDFQDERISRVVSIMFNLVDQGKAIEPQILMNHLGDDVLELVSESVFLTQNAPASEAHREKVVCDCIQRMKNEKIKLERQRLHEQIKVAQAVGDEELLSRLTEEFHCLIKKKAG
ncbi:MAG: DNA primase [Candidatus Omnitrophica bacterium]|nr:DNA primase [Candidatus Omnitrophota bacterium]MDD5518009.1 DNA primase [Candidatus Omnitrophota bacterium]